ncbi:MAG: hypothetical protein ABEK00_03685 [Candidatus Nanohaloarchaea archaeon]
MQTIPEDDRRWLGHLVSFDSPEEARQSASHLVEEFHRKDTVQR